MPATEQIHRWINRILLILWIGGTAAGLYFQFAYHKFLNNDTLAYINLAERYAAGDWSHAINGYWSPLYSWILAPCYGAGIPLHAACYVLNFAAAGACWWLIRKMAGRLLTTPVLYFAVSAWLLLWLLYYALSTLTPDLLSAACTLAFLTLITSPHFTQHRWWPVTAGIAAALMYFAKLYNFAALHLFFAAWLVWLFTRKRKTGSRLPGKAILTTYLVFLILSLGWIAALSIHEHRLTFATSGRLNHNLMNPAYDGIFPTAKQLYPPAFDGAYSAHTDPAHLMDAWDWSMFDNRAAFLHQLQLSKTAFGQLLWTLDNTGLEWLLLIGGVVGWFFVRKKGNKNITPALYLPVLFFVTYPLLYLGLFVIDRYVLINILLFHLFVFVVLQAWATRSRFRWLLPVMIALIVVSLVPLARIGQRKLVRSSGEYRYYKEFYEQLPRLSFLQNQSFASDAASLVEATQLSYYLHGIYYCTWADGKESSLRRYPIRFLVCKTPQSSPFLALQQTLVITGIPVYVYELKIEH